MTKINPFGVFLERLQQPDAVVDLQERSAESAAVTNVTETILQSLRSGSLLDPAALLNAGLDFVEVGRAIDRLRNLESIQTVDENGRQMIRRGPKYEEVCALLGLK